MLTLDVVVELLWLSDHLVHVMLACALHAARMPRILPLLHDRDELRFGVRQLRAEFILVLGQNLVEALRLHNLVWHSRSRNLAFAL